MAMQKDLGQAFDVVDAVYTLKLKTDEKIKSFVLDNLDKFLSEHHENYLGPQGIPGPQGVRGFDGPQGLVGLGILKIESRIVDNFPHLVLIRSDGKEFDLGNYLGPTGKVGPQGPQGLIGPEGPIGKTGRASEIHYIKVERDKNNPEIANLIIKYDSGEYPIEKNFGNISGPRGPRGQRGEQGIQGIKGDIGPIGPRGERGPIGLTGPMGITGPKGADATGAMVFRGEWKSNTSYKINDVVTYFGNLYVAIAKPTGKPGLDPAWKLLTTLVASRAGGALLDIQGVAKWQVSYNYALEDLVWNIDNKIYRAADTHASTLDFYNDYRAGHWINMSDGTATQSLLNGGTNIIIPSLKFYPSQYRMAFADILTMRKSDTVADSYYKVTLTLAWNGTAWIKNESSKTYFPGAPDDIQFSVVTDGADNNALVVRYTTPSMLGVYDTTFSKMFLSIKAVI